MTRDKHLEEFGTRIRDRRLQLGMTQEDLAQMMGYSHKASVNRLEKGLNNLPQTKIALLADCLQVDVGYLLGFDNEEEDMRRGRPVDRIMDKLEQLNENEVNVLEAMIELMSSMRR